MIITEISNFFYTVLATVFYSDFGMKCNAIGINIATNKPTDMNHKDIFSNLVKGCLFSFELGLIIAWILVYIFFRKD